MKRKITFREILNAEELNACFSLRYEQYKHSPYKVFLKENAKGIDFDEFDLFSRHWATFDENNELIGYARIIQSEINQQLIQPIQQLSKNYALTNIVLRKNGTTFPLINYQTGKSIKPLQSFLQQCYNLKVVELSRFIIKKGQSFLVSKFMINAGLGIYRNCLNTEVVILACSSRYEHFWKNYGFHRIKNDAIYEFQKLESVNLFSRFAGISVTLSETFTDFSEQYHLQNEVSIQL